MFSFQSFPLQSGLLSYSSSAAFVLFIIVVTFIYQKFSTSIFNFISLTNVYRHYLDLIGEAWKNPNNAVHKLEQRYHDLLVFVISTATRKNQAKAYEQSRNQKREKKQNSDKMETKEANWLEKKQTISNFPQFEITLDSETMSMDIMHILVSKDNTVTGISESGAILRWALDLTSLRNYKQKALRKPKKAGTSNTSHLGHQPSSSDKAADSNALLSPKSNKQHIPPKSSMASEIFFNDNENLKILKLAKKPDLIRNSILSLGLDFNTSVGDYCYDASQNSDAISDSELTISGIPNQYPYQFQSAAPIDLIKDELITDTQIDITGTFMAVLTESGKIGIYNNSDNSFHYFVGKNICSTRDNGGNFNPNNQSQRSNIQDLWLQIHSSVSSIRFAWVVSQNGQQKLVSEDHYIKNYAQIQVNGVNGGFLPVERIVSPELVLIVGHYDGSVSLLYVIGKSINIMWEYQLQTGSVDIINFDNQIITLGHSCGAITLLDSKSIPCTRTLLGFDRYIFSQITSSSIHKSLSHKYLVLGYSDGTALLFRIDGFPPPKSYCLGLKLLYVLSVGAELDQKLANEHFQYSHESINYNEPRNRYSPEHTTNHMERDNNSSPEGVSSPKISSARTYVSLLQNSKILSSTKNGAIPDIEFSKDLPIFEWPPHKNDNDSDPKIFRKPKITSSAEIGQVNPHTKRITTIKLRGTSEKKPKLGLGNCSCESKKLDTFYAITSCEGGQVRVCRIKIRNPFICKKHKKRGKGKTPEVLLVAHLIQSGSNQIDVDEKSGVVVGVRQIPSDLLALEDTQTSEGIHSTAKTTKTSFFSSTSTHLKRSPSEESSLRLTVQDIRHWIFALFVLIWRKLVSNMIIRKIVDLFWFYTDKLADKYTRIRVLFIMFTKYNNNEFNQYNETSYFSQWTSLRLEWFESQRADYDNYQIANDYEVSKNWEMWVLDLNNLAFFKRLQTSELSGTASPSREPKLTQVLNDETSAGGTNASNATESSEDVLKSDEIFPIDLASKDSHLEESGLFTTYSLYIDRSPPKDPDLTLNGTTSHMTASDTDKSSMPFLNQSDMSRRSNSLSFEIERHESDQMIKNKLNSIDLSMMTSSTTLNYALPFGLVKSLKIIQSRQDDQTPTVVALACGSSVKLVSV